MTIGNGFLAFLFLLASSAFAQNMDSTNPNTTGSGTANPSTGSLGSTCIPGFACETACPSAGAGFEFKELNCRCKKDKPNKKCKASGVCQKYTEAGKKVVPVVEADCLCEKTET